MGLDRSDQEHSGTVGLDLPERSAHLGTLES